MKHQFKGLIGSLFLGWWGFPWGLIITPIQVCRNIVGLYIHPDHTRPSEKLRRAVKLQLAANFMAKQNIQK